MGSGIGYVWGRADKTRFNARGLSVTSSMALRHMPYAAGVAEY